MLLAGCGGFVGTCGRYLVCHWSRRLFHGDFPLGTFIVNIVGCLLIGLILGILEKSRITTTAESAVLIAGFCGGFTTFSAFANELWNMGNKGEWGMSVLYLLASVIFGVLMVWVGRLIVR